MFGVPKNKAMPSPGLTGHNHNKLLLWHVNVQKESLQVWIQSCEKIIENMHFLQYHKCIVGIPKVRLVEAAKKRATQFPRQENSWTLQEKYI